MFQSQPAAADPAGPARPYGPLGLVLSLVAIASIAAALGALACGIAFLSLVALHGWQITRAELAAFPLAPWATAPDAVERVGVVLGLGAYSVQILAVLAVARFRGGRAGWGALLAWRDWDPKRHWRLLAGLMVLVLIWSVGASLALERLYPPSKDWISAPKGTPWILGFLALAVLLGPIAEEILFRGWIYTSLRAGFGLRVAVLATSVLFALAHWESTHLYALAVFPVGLALTIVRERTGSIAASITFHAIYNGVASVLLFVGK